MTSSRICSICKHDDWIYHTINAQYDPNIRSYVDEDGSISDSPIRYLECVCCGRVEEFDGRHVMVN